MAAADGGVRSAYDVMLGRAPAPGGASGGRLAARPAKRARTAQSGAGAQQPKAKSAAHQPPAQRQAIMALGQSNVKTECARCGMLYAPGMASDVAAHRRFCSATSLAQTVAFKIKTPQSAIVWQSFRQPDRFVVLVRADHVALAKKGAEMLAVVNRALGCSADMREDDIKTFLYVAAGQAVGCVVACTVKRARRVAVATSCAPGTGDNASPASASGADDTMSDMTAASPAGNSALVPVMSADSKQSASRDDLVVCDLTWHPAAIGISKIWVHPAHRRAGVARRLTDCARRHTVYGLAVAPADMAFSSPTPEGVAFARKYTGRPDFLIYT